MSNRSKNEAIASLKRLLTELETIQDVRNGNNWKAILKETLNLYLGNESSITERLDKLFFTRKEYVIDPYVIGGSNRYIYDESKKEDFKSLIQHAINHINDNGVNTQSQSGWLAKYFLVSDNSYKIGIGTFWIVLPLICTTVFFLGTIKYDADKISLVQENQALKDTINIRENTIKYLRHNSDSALNILSHMPYGDMKLDTNEFRKVQTNIENAGAALYLNK